MDGHPLLRWAERVSATTDVAARKYWSWHCEDDDTMLMLMLTCWRSPGAMIPHIDPGYYEAGVHKSSPFLRVNLVPASCNTPPA